MLEKCTTIGSCESLLSEQVHQVGLLGQIPLTNNDYEMLCKYVSEELSYEQNSEFEYEIATYPATLACYLVFKGIYTYKGGVYWDPVRDDIKECTPAKEQMLGKAFLRFVEKNGLFHVDIPSSHTYVMPILMHGIISQEQVQEYFEKIVYHLVTKELVCPADPVELSYWLKENRELEKEEERHGVLKKMLGDIPPEFLSDDYTKSDEFLDPDAIFEEIDALDQQIKALSSELKTLEQGDDQLEQYQALKRDLVTLKKYETALSTLEQRKEDVSERIRTSSQTYGENRFSSAFPDTVPDCDAIIASAETELIDYLGHVAETGSPDEKERLKEFIRAFSEGIDNQTITLSTEALEKFQSLCSVSMANLLCDDTYEMTDISASHANGITAITDTEPTTPYLRQDTSEPSEYSPAGAFQDIQSFYTIEDTFHDISDRETIPINDTLPSEISDIPDNITEVSPITEDPSPEPEVPCTDTESTDSPGKSLFPTETAKPIQIPDNKPELGRIARSLCIQIQNKKTEQNQTPNRPDTRHTLSAETILKARDELRETCPKETHMDRDSTGTESAYNAPAVSQKSEIPNNSPKEIISLFEDENTVDAQDFSTTEHLPSHSDEISDETEINSHSVEISFAVGDSQSQKPSEFHTTTEINLLELADIRDTTPVGTRSGAPARQPHTPPQALSLADDPKIPQKFRKKSLLSRLFGALFRKDR